MVHFVGAGSGAADLITVRGAKLLGEADVVIYAGSLVNPALLDYTREGCEIHDSAKLTLEEVIALIEKAEAAGKTTVRLHTGDSSIYGAVREQFDELEKRGIAYDVCPGVSAFCGAAAALRAEYTLPDVSQTVIITRAPGRTPVPERESIRSLAAHQATMVLFLSTSLTELLQDELLAGGYTADTPAAVVYKATWPEEHIFRCTVGTLHETVTGNSLTKTSLIAMKLGVAGFILPFFFLNNPVLLYGSTEGVALSETIRAFVTATLGVLAIAEGLSGLPMQKYNVSATALRLVTRAMLVAGGLLFVNPTLLTDAAALALIAAEVVIDRAVLPKVQRRMPLKAAAGANRSH